MEATARLVPSYFVYGEPDRPLDVGFVHVETVMARRSLHSGVVRAHKHDRMAQVTFWTRGRGRYHIEDARLDFSAPFVSYIPSGVVHGFEVEADASDAIVVSIADGALSALGNHTIMALDAPVAIGGADGDTGGLWDRLGRLMQLAADEYAQAPAQADIAIAPLVAAALTQVARLASSCPPLPLAPDRRLALQLRHLIDLHFREPWPVERYAALAGVTPHRLAAASKAAFGAPVKDLIGGRRLLEAKRLLSFTMRSVEDIAYEVGFGDAAYFSRFFRSRMGVPPGVWRSGQSGR